ncbi:MAG: ATP-binding protein [Acidimicrobiales bacterium]|nr:ATP-binding protein [Acidimicrobiales bacterium]MBO0886453.1 ATP-binding protein [Acidimicrobiales bacterium]
MSPPDDPRASGVVALTQTAELTFSADPDLVMLARMVAAATASRAGFSIEQVEDLRLAVNELCLGLIGTHAAEGRLQVRFGWSEDIVEVMATYHPRGAPSHSPARSRMTEQELSTRILDTLVDEYGLEQARGTPQAWLRVRRRTSAS